jgi:hypothetical protein
MSSRERKQWRIGQPVPVANSRVTYPVRYFFFPPLLFSFLSQIGDRRRSLSPTPIPINDQSKILKEDPPDDIYKVNLISDLKDRSILVEDLWIPCWYSPKQHSLFWVEDSKVSDLQASFYCPSSYQTIMMSAIQRAGYFPVQTPSQCRRRSWSGPTRDSGRLDLTSGSNKENQSEKWMIGYISGLFNQRSPSQKIFFQAEEARRVGIRTVIPVFLQDLDLDATAPFLILSDSLFRFSLPPSSHTQRLIVDCTGALLSVSFKKAIPSTSSTKDSHLSQQRNALSQFLPPAPSPSSHFFLNCTHFHSLDDMETLESILRNLDLGDLTSIAEWIPILDKDSNLLLRELYQILLRSLSSKAPKEELELQVAHKSSSLILICWKIHPDCVSCDLRLTGELFNKILTLLSGTINAHLERLIPLVHLANHIARYAHGGLSHECPENLVLCNLLQYLLSVEIASPLSEGISSLLSALWFRNILRHQILMIGSPSPCDHPSSRCLLLHSQLASMVTASDGERLANIFGVPHTPLRFEALATLVPPVCTWTTRLLRLCSLPSDTSDKEVRVREDLSQRIVTIRLMVTSLTLLLLIQQSRNSSVLSFSVDWDLVHHSLAFLISHKNLSTHRTKFLETMTQLVDFLSFVFVDLGWLRNQDNGSRYRDTILQVTLGLPALVAPLTSPRSWRSVWSLLTI